MALTVIPAPDYSASARGWDALADDVVKQRQDRQLAYQALIRHLSDPATTEDEQNAILTQDPKQFLRTYGVPIDSVGKDVATFTQAATPLNFSNGMMGQGLEPSGSKRLLVPHPEGTQQQQAAQAAITKVGAETEQARASAEADRQRTDYYRKALGLNEREAAIKDATFVASIKASMRTADGKVPTLGQVQDFRAGTFDLYPTTEAGKKLESIREIFGGDPNDPAVDFLSRDLTLDQNVKEADLDRLKADAEAARALAQSRSDRALLISQGINPNTMKPFAAGEIDPQKMIAVGKGFNEAINSAMGPLGFPSDTRVQGQGAANLAAGARATWVLKPIGGLVDYFTIKDKEYPELSQVLFGSGRADPASVRADIQQAVGKDTVLKTIKIPSVDKKTGLPAMLDLPVDQAIPQIVQVRRKLATELPAAFAAMRTASPQTLLEMAAGNPMIERAARSYAPDIAAVIDKARAESASSAAQGAATGDQNVAPLIDMRDKLQGQIDDLRRLIQGQATPPPRTDNQR